MEIKSWIFDNQICMIYVKLKVKFKALEDRKSSCKIKLLRLIFDDLLKGVFSRMIIMCIEF